MTEPRPNLRRAELLQELLALAHGRDPELDHFRADCLLVAYLNDPELAAAYDRVVKGYFTDPAGAA